MPTVDDLTAAVEHGIIDAGQAEKLKSFLVARADNDPWEAAAIENRAPEDVRFVRGFHDIFIAVGIALLFIGFGIAATSTSSGTAIFILATLVAWILAEYLARVKRLVLPTIVIVVFFALYSGAAVLSVVSSGPIRFGELPSGGPGVVAAGSAVIAIVLFYLRFRLPFALGIIAAAGLVFWYVMLQVFTPEFTRDHRTLIFLISGVVIFAAAMSYDLSDPRRQTLRADNAFWLHLLAAPLLVHTVLSSDLLSGGKTTSLIDAALIVAVVAVLALIALLVDRRALLVAGLGYLGVAIAAIIGTTSAETSTVIAITLIVLGTGVVMLGTGWQPTRRMLLRIAPLPSGLKNQLPPPAGQS